MAFTDLHNNYTLYLSPSLRGATDTIREPLMAFLGESRFVHLCSQQVADNKIVDALADLENKRNGRAKVLIESDYIYERKPLAGSLIWEMQGEREQNRQCLLAMMRGGVEVRADQIKGALQHTNLILSEKEDGGKLIFVTSANLSPGSIGTHYNWGIVLNNPPFFDAAQRLFNNSWDGDFRDAFFSHEAKFAKEVLACAAGANGQATDLAEECIDKAEEYICFAYFNLSTDSRVDKALRGAIERGVRVYGVVDGDQAGTSWDAVPQLRKIGVDVRYYPGVLTGALGRMHYKMLSVDGKLTHVTTANASHAAEDSFEFGLTIISQITQNISHFIQSEIDRLMQNARVPQEDT
ncbi:phosphatidylserine/phosphatidylglycerophosphate/cardiolipin synthase family protein [Desulforhopalus sp. IMCC35007]|uniref:phospholipase D-like domain-containing protein n=1 Tax=Desulforhopalus sp. IMCC35007 TaxID=2569543 RepID=UPI00145E6C77|nr:phospholipase D-like domain-containing protein [Desulforhopalus sp. IMCC35007]